ncbi:Rv0361 family membrane protein [Nocardia sputi]|uniref:Rv0361 family membrane protein n=2 Tax=Nocardiaceae TaxID=85025 RepID=UPI0020BDB4DD|nr:nuclear transport factor 2 family protein [Nocardia sputi]
MVIKRDQLPSATTRGSAAASGSDAKESAKQREQPAADKTAPGSAAKAAAAAKTEAAEPAEAAPGSSADTTRSGKAAASDSDSPSGAAETAAPPQGGPAPAGEGATVVMRKPQPPAGQAGPGSATAAEPTQGNEQNPPGSDDVTMAMPVVGLDDAKTVALPIQRPADGGRPGTDRVVAPPAGPVPITKPPSTPRPASGPKQSGPSGPQGPSAPPQHGPGVEETRPSPQRSQGRPRQVATAPSPADVQQTVPAQSMAGPRAPHTRPVAPPQRIAPAPQPGAGASATASAGINRRLLGVGAAVVLVVALVAAIVALVTMTGEDSPETQVRGAITSYTEALRAGDLEALRSSTCGPLHDFYQGIPSDQFAGVHKLSMERKNIPVVDSVDAIRITDDTAIAQATVYTEADPAKRSARTFDLQRTDGGWKVCDPPSGTQ